MTDQSEFEKLELYFIFLYDDRYQMRNSWSYTKLKVESRIGVTASVKIIL